MMSVKSVRIDANRIYLEPFSMAHLTDNYIQWLNDPVVVRYSEQRHVTHTRESCFRYFQSFAQSAHLFYAIMLMSHPNEHIGNMTVFIDPYNKIADIGILIGEKKHWGNGYGLEAWKAMSDYLFASGIRKVTAGTMASNQGMLKIMQRSEMQLEGRRYKHFLHEGKEEDLIFYAISL